MTRNGIEQLAGRADRLRNVARHETDGRTRKLAAARHRAAVVRLKLAQLADEPGAEAEAAAGDVEAVLATIEAAFAAGNEVAVLDAMPQLETAIKAYQEAAGIEGDELLALAEGLEGISAGDTAGGLEVCAAIREAIGLPPGEHKPERAGVEELRRRLSVERDPIRKREIGRSMLDAIAMRGALTLEEQTKAARLRLDPRELAITGGASRRRPRHGRAYGRGTRIV